MKSRLKSNIYKCVSTFYKVQRGKIWIRKHIQSKLYYFIENLAQTGAGN